MEKSIQKRGRPRSEASRESILAAAFQILCERGYEQMAIEAVAALAKVGKATIYRWWPNRQELAVESFFSATVNDLAFPNTGSAREDFRQQIRQLATLLRGNSGQAMAAMIAAARVDPVLRHAMATRWVAPRRKWGLERLQAAIAANECVPHLNPAAALELLYSPIYARLLFGLGIPSDEDVQAFLDIAFQGIFLPPPPQNPSVFRKPKIGSHPK